MQTILGILGNLKSGRLPKIYKIYKISPKIPRILFENILFLLRVLFVWSQQVTHSDMICCNLWIQTLLHRLVNKHALFYRPPSYHRLLFASDESNILLHDVAWSSVDKGESLACQITYPFNKKIGCCVRQPFKFY